MTDSEGEIKKPWFLHFTAADQERLKMKVLDYLDRENVFGDHFSEYEILRIGDLLDAPWREPPAPAPSGGEKTAK